MLGWLLLALLGAPSEATAQLRPLDPLEWRVFRGDVHLLAEAGGGAFFGQRASLAGTEGTLAELGNVRVVWRTGRVALEAAGTLQRLFREEARFTDPHPEVRGLTGSHRRDSGDYRVSTAVRLTGAQAPLTGVLRFGSRLPTTDNQEGLDRDATDFFALVGGHLQRGPASFGVEGGVSINGTRDPAFEQSDVFTYTARGEYAWGPVAASATLAGQVDGLEGWTIRGNEDLGEVRVGLRAGRLRWARAELVRGFTDFSPGLGVIISAGAAW